MAGKRAHHIVHAFGKIRQVDQVWPMEGDPPGLRQERQVQAGRVTVTHKYLGIFLKN